MSPEILDRICTKIYQNYLPHTVQLTLARSPIRAKYVGYFLSSYSLKILDSMRSYIELCTRNVSLFPGGNEMRAALKTISDVLMGTMASQITSLMIVYSTVYSGTDQRKHQSSASLAFVRGIHQWPVISPHKGPVKWKMFPFDDVTMIKAVFLVNWILPLIHYTLATDTM